MVKIKKKLESKVNLKESVSLVKSLSVCVRWMTLKRAMSKFQAPISSEFQVKKNRRVRVLQKLSAYGVKHNLVQNHGV